MNEVYLCLGGNLGNREENISDAIRLILSEIGEIQGKSSIYQTEAWGVQNQQAYLNQVIKISTQFSPNELLEKLLSIEKQLGRKRIESANYESRTIDIDILFYNNLIYTTENLEIPHPRLHLRNFVLIPLNQINSELTHPVFNKSIKAILAECTDVLQVKEHIH
jgi:2-amino-4-hydroxy-6-hydroxymethyldihydropteridine diphosphokinase